MEATQQRVSNRMANSHCAVERNWVFDNSWRVALLIVAAFFVLADNIVQAGVVWTATLVKDPGGGVPFGAPDAALPAGFVSYQLSIEGTYGDVVGAVDVHSRRYGVWLW